MPDRKTILLVEDEALIAIAQKKTLEKHGYGVITVYSGKKAVEKVRATQDIDLVLMDIDLGKDKMDGTEAAGAILKDHDIPVVFLSSHTEKDVVEKTERITSYGYVVKGSGETVLDASIKMAFKLHEAHRELKETKEAADRYLNVAAELILSLDSRGSITLLNDSGHRLLGYDRGELIGKNWFDTCLPERLREEVKGVFEKLVQERGEDVLTYENLVLTKSGEELIILWHNTMLRDEGGEIVTILSSGEDITSRKRAEALLQETNEDLLERKKELECFHNISEILRRHTVLTASLFQEIVDTIPPAFLHPHAACTRLDIRGRDYESERFEETEWQITAPLTVRGEESGSLSVYYREEQPEQDRGPFIGHEVKLIETIAERIGKTIEELEAEAALKESEKTLQSFFDAVHESMVLIDTKGTVLLSNMVGAQRLGRTVEELVGTCLYDSFPPDVARHRKEQYDRVVAEGESVYFEDVREGRSFEHYCDPVFTQDGKVSGVTIFAHETTSRKKAEATFRESEAKYRSLFENAIEGIYQTSPDGRYISANPALARFFGYDSPQDLMEQTIDIGRQRYADPQDRLTFKGTLEREGTITGFETQLLRKDGSPIWASMNARAVKDDMGAVIYYEGTAEDITERKYAEEALKDSEQKYRLMAENIQDVFWIATPDIDRMIYVSPAYERIWGRNCQNLYDSPSSFIDAVHPEDRQRVIDTLHLHRSQETPWVTSYRVVRPDGTIRWVEDRGYPVRDANGSVCLNTGTATDITEQRETTGRLQESESRYRNVSGAMAGYVYSCMRLTGGEYTIDWMAGATEQITGYTIDEIKDWGCWKPMVHPDHIGVFDENILCLSPDAERECEIKIVRKNGEERWVKSSARCVLETGGSTHRLYGACVDITHRKLTEAALRESYERLESIIEGTHAGTWEWNVQTGETVFNEVWAQILGYTLEELAPVSIKTWETFAHPDDLRQSAELLERHFAGELPYYDYDCRMRHKDGHWVWVHDRGRVITRTDDEKPLMMFGTHTDITERKLAEGQIKSLLAEKELLLKEVHHRIKNNMNVISSLLTLQAGTLKDPSAIAALKESGSRVRSMVTLYDKLYESAGFNAISVINYLPTLVDEIVENFPNSASVKIEKKIDDFILDAKRLQPLGIIINELLTNIMKYAFTTGKDGDSVTVSATLAGNSVSLVVEDNGNGMPESVDFENSPGFGLMLVGILTEQLDGTIRIERENGTKIILEFGV